MIRIKFHYEHLRLNVDKASIATSMPRSGSRFIAKILKMIWTLCFNPNKAPVRVWIRLTAECSSYLKILKGDLSNKYVILRLNMIHFATQLPPKVILITATVVLVPDDGLVRKLSIVVIWRNFASKNGTDHYSMTF
jgi:hypothetical protein